MSPRPRRLPRAACPLRPIGVVCHAFGAETACGLCNMIDMDAPTTVVTLGRSPSHGDLRDAEAAFYDHLARRHDGGPCTRDELREAASRGKYDRYPAAHSPWGRPSEPVSTLPVEPPF